MRKFFLGLTVILSMVSFSSCKEDGEELNQNPSDIIDTEHVSLNDRYGITAICKIGEWSNNYQDTMPPAYLTYAANYRYNQIALMYNEDKVSATIGDTTIISYPNYLNLMRFHATFDTQEAAYTYVENYKKDIIDIFDDYYYNSISSIKDTTISSYKAKYFSLNTEGSYGTQEFFFMYNNSRLYSAVKIYNEEYASEGTEQALDEVLSTIKLK